MHASSTSRIVLRSLLACAAILFAVFPATGLQDPAPIITPEHCCVMAIEATPETLPCNSVSCYLPGQGGCTAQGRTASSTIVGSICKYDSKLICKRSWVQTQLDVYRCNTDFTSCTTPERKCNWEYNNAGDVKGHYQCDASSDVCGI